MRFRARLLAISGTATVLVAASPLLGGIAAVISPSSGPITAFDAPAPAQADQLAQFDQFAQAQTAKPVTPAPTTGAKPAGTPAATPAPATAAKPGTTAAGTPAAATPPLSLSQSDQLLVVTLLRTTLVAVYQADVTGNYTVLGDLGAPGFHDKYSATALADVFAPIRTRNIDLSQVVVLDPHLAVAKINDQGMLDVAGSLATLPVPVNFEILYQGVANSWQLFGVQIVPVDAAQVATQPSLVPPASGQPAAGAAPAAPGAKPPVPTARP